jgi:hypothetical protein
LKLEDFVRLENTLRGMGEDVRRMLSWRYVDRRKLLSVWKMLSGGRCLEDAACLRNKEQPGRGVMQSGGSFHSTQRMLSEESCVSARAMLSGDTVRQTSSQE